MNRDLEFAPWRFWAEADEAEQADQLDVQRAMAGSRPEHSFAEKCFVSELASVQCDRLDMGRSSYIAAGALVTGSIEMGTHCTINAYSIVRGPVRFGRAVRVGAHTSIIGFNHTMTDPDTDVFRQPISERGIEVGDDVWIGSHCVILDGVRIGERSVIAAGAVVTKDVPAGAVVAGNPARVLRWRVPALAPSDATAAPGMTPGPAPAGRPDPDLEQVLRAFGDRARSQGAQILARAWDARTGLFADKPGGPATVRAQCDAVEIADLLTGHAPPQRSREETVAMLRGWQDPRTGLVGELGRPDPQAPPDLTDPDAAYHVLSVGYALDLLGSSFPTPIHAVAGLSADDIVTFLDGLPWPEQAWRAGHWVDALGTALLWNRRQDAAAPPGQLEALIGWLILRADPQTGMWGQGGKGGLLQPVNGFYRASRGTLAQFGIAVPHAERVVDTVLRHARDARYFTPERQNACNVLDVAHPLWLVRAHDYRTAEQSQLAERLLRDCLGRWHDDAGFGFSAGGAAGARSDAEPGLQGTEMWLSIIWLLADLLGLSGALGYRPRGVHRPEAATSVAGLGR
ncbi:acyltransferase [Occultella glacieicola]|uniref:Acyltransferase n=1 Tax=Occultella glacieicola TaxID=2518684 RepID=A0ABY2E6G3_9MICO|nr:acyltransferase [Occultella glacieicola]TDE95110.1 acyltransferase [Occultella glacieicola]